MFEGLDLDQIRHQIDRLTVTVPDNLSRTDVVTWFMINYLAGARDILTSSLFAEIEPFGDSLAGDVERQAVIVAFTEKIHALAAMTSWSGELR